MGDVGRIGLGFAWRRHEDQPACWSFELCGGAQAPRVARAAVGRVLRGRVAEPRRADAVLLVSEAVTNSVLHGGAGLADRLELTVSISPEAARVEVTDPTGGFEPPEPPDDPLATGGRGLPVVRALARVWGVDNPPRGRLWFEVPCRAA